MFDLVCNTIMKLYTYANMTKMIHYSAKTDHEHKLCDDVKSALESFADKLAEQYFGYYGKPSFSDFSLNQDVQKTDDLGKLCGHVINLTALVRTKASKVDKLQGIVSLIDDFTGELNKLIFLTKFNNISSYKSKENI